MAQRKISRLNPRSAPEPVKQSPAPVPGYKGEVQIVLQQLFDRVSDLGAAVATLRDNLTPVSLPRPGLAVAETEEPAPGNSPISSQLAQLLAGIDAVTASVNEATDSLTI